MSYWYILQYIQLPDTMDTHESYVEEIGETGNETMLTSLRTNPPFSTSNHSLCLKLGQQNNTIILTQPFGKFVITIVNKRMDFFIYIKHNLAKFIVLSFGYFSMNRVTFILNLVEKVNKFY